MTFQHKSFFFNKFAEHCFYSSPKIVPRKKYINVHMETLKQDCPMFTYLFHSFGLAAAPIEILC